MYLLDMCEGRIHLQHPTPPQRHSIGGMGFNPLDGLLYCGSGDEDRETVIAIDPLSGTVQREVDLAVTTNVFLPGAFATNGFFMARGAHDTLELMGMNGVKLGERTYPGRVIRGLTASPFSWTFLDATNNEIVVIDPFGNVIATAPAPGAPPAFSSDVQNGGHALAFDMVNHPYTGAQLCIPSEDLPEWAVDENGYYTHTPYHQDTPWSPTPWQFRHRIFVANQTSNTIYGGYLTASPP
ncbi:hypothetical protein [Aliiroseovarius subalbicans]|uniref:hypothetical protein n=1 Tax=Aliiroseovarius subalbicans TaxID=2925840 RepID=UPI001F58B7E0|nr:hypothetical protein [Aliiroseovarius subalbicans]MCI2398488.1 hypothetical protein [Aliiroseovarius subalbicans]